MKLVVLFGLLGLSMAGFRGDLKKAGHWISKHHKAIETGVGDAIKVGSIIADASLVNVEGLIQDGIKTVGDATAQKKNVGDLIIDGLKIIGDLTEKNGNTEELLHIGDILHDAGDVAHIVEAGAEVADLAADASFVNVQGLIKDGIQTVQDATAKKKNVGDLIVDGLKIIGDLTEKNGNTEELFSFSDALHDAGDVAGVVSAGAEVAGLFA